MKMTNGSVADTKNSSHGHMKHSVLGENEIEPSMEQHWSGLEMLSISPAHLENCSQCLSLLPQSLLDSFFLLLSLSSLHTG